MGLAHLHLEEWWVGFGTHAVLGASPVWPHANWVGQQSRAHHVEGKRALCHNCPNSLEEVYLMNNI